MGFFSDLKVLYHLALKPVRGKNHAERMESFYGGQAEAYDDFRKRLLKGREDLLEVVVADDQIALQQTVLQETNDFECDGRAIGVVDR